MDELQRKVPPTATVAAVEQRHTPKKTWAHKKPDNRKRPCSYDGDQGGQGDAEKKAKPWETISICWAHHRFGEKTWDCKPSCLLAGN